MYAIDHCPICGCGLLGVRYCTGRTNETDIAGDDDASELIPINADHGLVVCDECEAIWLGPDPTQLHLYPDCEDARCPLCNEGLWSASHWADADEIRRLGWQDAVREDLFASSESSEDAIDESR